MAESGRSSPAPTPAAEASELEELRRRIDAVDRAILERLNERARLVEAVGRLKRANATAVYEAGRERRIVEELVATNPGPFPDAGLAPVFREIISATRSLEAGLRVAYLGPEGTFSHLAARYQFGELAELSSCATIGDVFASVERGKATLGIVPAENTTEGAVTPTLDALAVSDVSVCGEALLPISHDLLSQSGRREDVVRVASHPQPLAQCRGWLDRHLPDAERVETTSTAVAAQLAAEDGQVAALGSSIAAEVYGLRTVEAAVEDRRDNTTRFLVIGRQHAPASGNDLTSAVFTLRKDESGALFRLLEPFARQAVNLTSIHLRPMKGKPWEYLFFLDAEGHRDDERVRAALGEAAALSNEHRILGSFPRAASARVGSPRAPGTGREKGRSSA